MHIKFLLLTNVVLTFAADVPRAANHRYDEEDRLLVLNDKNNKEPAIIRNNTTPQIQDSQQNKSNDDEPKSAKIVDPWNLSKDTDQIQFQIEGHDGPKTYIFGFDTGYGKNRQYRLEERHRDGTVKGQYGYYDAKGKLRRVRYVAKPLEGYTEIHHESTLQRIEK